jgi:hypothetical protein
MGMMHRHRRWFQLPELEQPPQMLKLQLLTLRELRECDALVSPLMMKSWSCSTEVKDLRLTIR